MSGGENMKMTPFYISSKFTVFWGHKGAKPGVKMGENVPISLKKHDIIVIFREYVT